MRVLGSIIGVHAAWSVSIFQTNDVGSGSVRGEFVRNDCFRVYALVLEQFPQQFQRSSLVAPLLDQHVQDLAFIIDCAPEEHVLAADELYRLLGAFPFLVLGTPNIKIVFFFFARTRESVVVV